MDPMQTLKDWADGTVAEAAEHADDYNSWAGKRGHLAVFNSADYEHTVRALDTHDLHTVGGEALPRYLVAQLLNENDQPA